MNNAIDRLVSAAKEWAAYQDGDSLEDQASDDRLRANAIEAREKLLSAIEALDGAYR